MSHSLRIVVTDQPKLTAEEAREITNQVKDKMHTVGIELYQLYSREGWRAMGYSSWEAYRDAEFADMHKSYFYRLLRASHVSAEVGIPVIERHARVLSSLPENRQAEAYQIATASAGEGEVTYQAVKEAVEKVASTLPAEDVNSHKSEKRVTGRVVSTSGATAPTPDETAKKHEGKRDHFDRALAVLREVCDPKVAKAIEAKTFEKLRDSDVILWTEEKGRRRANEQIHQIHRLVTGGERCTVVEALSILSQMPEDRTRLSQMHNLAIASNGATVATVGGATHVTVTAAAPKWAHKALAELVSKIQGS